MIATSRNGITIRLPDERWKHITERHNILADKQQFVLNTIFNPARIFVGNEGALMALRDWNLVNGSLSFIERRMKMVL